MSAIGLSEGSNHLEANVFGQQKMNCEHRQATHIRSGSSETPRACLGGYYTSNL